VSEDKNCPQSKEVFRMLKTLRKTAELNAVHSEAFVDSFQEFFERFN
jgi:hypothetical protein